MIDKLDMFIALANERHFGRAAEACGVTQPTLSSAIRALEEQLGVQLVRRGARFQGLTAEGERALDWARRIVADARALRAEMRQMRSGLSGELRIGVIPTALPMAQAVTQPFLARHPNMRVTVLSRTTDEIIDGITRLDLDAGITYLESAPPERLTALPLYDEDYRLVISRDLAFAGDTASWMQVAQLPLALLTADMQHRRNLDRHLAEAGVAVRPGVESNSIIVLVSHVMTGLWASVLPGRLAELFAGSEDGLRSLPIDDPTARHPVGLIAARREPPTPAVAALFEAVARGGAAVGSAGGSAD